ncbi:MAG: PD-(D/E)XK nuclease family protein [Actinobacteria bacterium]|nr:PD-(D/E)XK nuclease family protein [Actinomycetota bacterium]
MADLVITNSLIKQFKSCQNATKYKHIELLAPRVSRSKPLKRGVWFHDMLEARYKGESVTAVHKANCAKYGKLFDEEKEILGDLPTEMADLYRAYRWHYRDDESWTVLDVELKLEAELPNGMQGQGKVDVIIEDEFGLWIVDHKTHLRMPTWDYRALDPQAPLYIWMARKNGIPVRGFIWNYVVPTAPKPLNFNKNGSLSKRQPAVVDFPTVTKDLGDRYTHDLLHTDVRDILTKLERVRYDRDSPSLSPVFRRDLLEPDEETIDRFIDDLTVTADRYQNWLQTTGTGYPMVERSVSRNCEWCDYRTLCVAELTGMNADGVRHREFIKADPFEYYKDKSNDANV